MNTFLKEFPKELPKTVYNYLTQPIGILIFINVILALVSLIKDIFLAGYLGTSAEADAFVLSFFIVDTIGNNLFASTLIVAALPVVSQVFLDRGRAGVRRLSGKIIFWSILICFGLVLLIYFFRSAIVANFGEGLSSPIRELAEDLLVILLPVIILYPLINTGMTILQVDRRFALSALGQVIFNAVFMVGTIFLYYSSISIGEGVFWLAFLVLSAVLVQIIFTWYSLLKKSIGFPDFRGLREATGEIGSIARNFIPYFMVLVSVHVVYAVERYLAAGLETGTVAALNYCFRLVQFPVWVFIAAVSTVAFPTFARKYFKEGREAFSRSVSYYLYVGCLFTLPLSIFLFIYREPIVHILFERGAFDHHSTVLTTTIMTGYVFTIVWQGFSAILVRASYIRGRVFVPLTAGLAAMTITIILDFLLVRLWGAAAIGYAAAVGAFINFLILYTFLRLDAGLSFSSRFRTYLPLLVSNALVLGLSLILRDGWKGAAGGGMLVKLGYLSIVGLCCLIIYVISYFLFKRFCHRYNE